MPFCTVCIKEGLEDSKQICGALSQLKNEMQTNKKLTDLPEDGLGDEVLWNVCLEADRQIQQAEGAASAWFISPWLLIECYFYRRICSAIRLRFFTAVFYFYFLDQELISYHYLFCTYME